MTKDQQTNQMHTMGSRLGASRDYSESIRNPERDDSRQHGFFANAACTTDYCLHPRQLTCPLKRDDFNRKYIFQLPTIDFQWTC